MQQETHQDFNLNQLPNPKDLFSWPLDSERNQKWHEAAKRWAVLRKAYPDHPDAWFHEVNAYMEAGELNIAEILLVHCRQNFPNTPNFLTHSAALAIHRREWEIADKYLKDAREKYPDHPQTWMKSAECAEGKGELEQAAVYYQAACRYAPNKSAPLIKYAELAMRSEQWEEAQKRWGVVRELFPDLPVGYARAAEAARKLGRPKDAQQLFLAYQYGSDIFANEPQFQNPPRKLDGHGNLRQLLELIWTKAIFNLRSEVHRSYLSYGWWILEPLLHMVVYYVVFGLLLQRGGEGFSTFLLTGLVPYMWLMKTVSMSKGSILAGQNLILQVGLPSLILPLVSIFQATLKQIPVFLLLFGFVWSQGYYPDFHWLALLPVIIVQALFILAFSCSIAAVIPFVRDLSYLVPTGLTFLMFISGIFYDYRSISQEWQEAFLMNPVAFLLKCYREIFMDGILPDFITLFWWGLGSGITCLFLMLFYQRLRYIYPRIIME